MNKRKFFAYDTDRTGNMDEVRTLAEIQMEDLPFHGKLTEPFLTLTNKDFYPTKSMDPEFTDWPIIDGAPFNWPYHGYYLIKPASVLSDWLTGLDKVAWKATVYSSSGSGEIVMVLDSKDMACAVKEESIYTRYGYWSGGSVGDLDGDSLDFDIGFLIGKPTERAGTDFAMIMALQDLIGSSDVTIEFFKVTPAKPLEPEVTGFTRVIFSDFDRNDQTFKCSMTAREIMAAACKGPVYGYCGDPDGNIEEVLILSYLGSENAPITAYFGMPDWQMWHLGNDTAPAFGICITEGDERAKRISRIPA